MFGLSVYYEDLILKKPKLTLGVMVFLLVCFGIFSTKFRLDASADTLVLENDTALAYYRSIKARYGSDDSLIVTFTPKQDLFSPQSLNTLSQLKQDLLRVDGITAVTSILDVPLVNSPKISLEQLQRHIPTLESASVDKELAKTEFANSPLYKNLLISSDAKTTALHLSIYRDETYYRLLKQRNALRKQRLDNELSDNEKMKLNQLEEEFYHYSSGLQQQQKSMILAVRQVLDDYRDRANIYLGGVPMITADSIDFIAHDILVFGLAVFVFLIIILVIAFGKPRWVILPLLTCLAAGVFMLGLLGALDWPVTVVSANFISLMLIITLSLTIHLIVRYQELHAEFPDASQYWLVKNMIRKKFLPCFYTAITTMVAFGSLLVSFIRPVIDFGWMMTIGMAVAFVLSFTLFPALLLMLSPGKPFSRRNFTGRATEFIALKIQAYPRGTLYAYLVVVLISIWGMFRLTVENRFIDYYKESTEIYQGMELIDQELGGTTPLEVIIDAPVKSQHLLDQDTDIDADFLAELGMDREEFLAEQEKAGITAKSYWFNVVKLADIKAIHDYLDGLSETGKVLSIASAIEMLKPLDSEVANDNFLLAVLYNKLPPSVKSSLITPYFNEADDQLRFSIRVFESDASLKRSELLDKIKQRLTGHFGLAQEQVHLTGMLVLYNNMLQSLFQSQILTIGVVFVAILLMFMVLFKNLAMAVIAIIPNLIAAGMVLGIMGLMKIPLDLMTITIAAICIGIAVDDSIHYTHRFMLEFDKDKSYWRAVERCHGSIGRAMYYTSITVMLGFSILSLSNFVPTVYFGLLTGFSMVVALLANLTLLPLLIVKYQPFTVRSKVS